LELVPEPEPERAEAMLASPAPQPRLRSVLSHLRPAAGSTAAADTPAPSGVQSMLARKEIPPRRPRSEWSAEEEELRVELAAAYRVCALLGWEDSINNHLTVMMPAREGQPPTFLVNSYGYAWEEVTASSLIEIDLQGNILDPGSAADDFDGDAFRSPRVLPAAFAMARPSA